ncbi:MAG: tetratricopeptide repeat protein [Brevinematia bacterium]
MEFVIIAIVSAFFISYYLFMTFREVKIKKAEKAVRSGDLDTALAIFMESLRKNPNDIETLWHLGNINEEKKLYPEAIGYYTKLIEIGKESKYFSMFELYRRVGILYRKIGREQDALDFLLQASNLLSSSKDVLYNIASIVFSQKYFFRALPYFEKAVGWYKNNPEFLKEYGFCYLMVDKFEEASPLLEASNKLDDTDYRKKFLLSYVYLRLGYFSKAKELIEEAANKYKDVMDIKELFFAVKMLYLIYLNENNYDIVKDLITQMENINNNIQDNPFRDDISMANFFFRVHQKYYDIALEILSKTITFKTDQKEISEEDKQSQSHLYEIVSTLSKYKVEKELQLYSEKKFKSEIEFSELENKAMEADKELTQIFEKWKWNFLNKETLWEFFGPKVETRFDPTIIIEKYAENKINVLKKQTTQPKKEKIEEEEQVVSSEDICEKIYSMDIPSFLNFARELADKMGFKIINQNVKTDPVASAEGQAIDFLCVEKYQPSNRVLFCFRRWKEPIGYLSLMNVISVMKEMKVNRLVIVSTSKLSFEAGHAVENDKRITFYLCEDVVHYLG